MSKLDEFKNKIKSEMNECEADMQRWGDNDSDANKAEARAKYHGFKGKIAELADKGEDALENAWADVKNAFQKAKNKID